jgi:TolB protein
LVKNLEDNLYPTWSPDGRCLIYTRYSDNTGNLFKQCLAGGPAQALTAYEVGLETLPDWSPDGQQVLYVSDEGGGTEIWLMAPDGSGARTLFSEVRYAWRPRWSFDGQWVYFASIPQNDLYRVRPDGSDLMRLPPCRT